ncbi:hypothetical protein LS74_000060 [Helicobacter magdeburgensis]|uniref:Uncharacterized protein n=1 Tax=Helicobacter magdeburgensis TaxID=471858 RepID=A0A4U8T2Y9_9HELI|nr:MULTISPECIES: hypothetical protein [Helicobacter]AWK61769.1 hypothetical protein C6B36_04935 [Helicobacter cinaedi]QOQ95866.1 hypothetical protein HW245_09785 [Helicobacter cinaedi]TLD93781.1 hypothetical protein LS74_000020 [Helicobacter magdeburgensis]TLD93786.1 hypothetical protein LS74_000060 [Helicobacter magdeburgensis]BDB64583.1 hypothetical protein T36_1039 [Helicobacter cinaedi]
MFYRVYYKLSAGGKINEAKAKLKKDIDNMQRDFKKPKHHKRRSERQEMLKELQENLEKQIAEQSPTESAPTQKKGKPFMPPKPKAQGTPLQSKHFQKKDEAMRFMKQHYEIMEIMLIYKHTDKYGWEMIFDKYTPKDF